MSTIILSYAIAKEYTLFQTIKTALKNNPTLKEKQKEIEVYKQEKNIIKGNFYPKIDIYTEYTRLSDPAAVVPIKGIGNGNLPIFSRDQYKSGISLFYPLYEGGAIKNQYKIAKLSLSSSLNNINSIKEHLIAKIINTFNNILFLHS